MRTYRGTRYGVEGVSPEQNALRVFGEELGELAMELLALQQHVSKAERFGIDEQRDLPTSNRERIQAEWNDLLASMANLSRHGIDLSPNHEAIEAKLNKIARYTEYSESLGTVFANHHKQEEG